jgi:hypothetical protein
MKQSSSQIAPPQDGVHFVDILPEAPPGSVMLVHTLNDKLIAGVWVHPDHGGTPQQPFPEVVRAAWEFWNARHEATSSDVAFEANRPAPRLLELL